MGVSVCYIVQLSGYRLFVLQSIVIISVIYISRSLVLIFLNTILRI